MNTEKKVESSSRKKTNPWSWIPTLYFAEGLPYIIVTTVSVIMYKRMGISNADIALYTSWLYLPWVIKALWSPFVDIFGTKRFWITIMQLIIGAGMAGVALTIPMPDFFQFTLLFFWLIAFSTATHDIPADGFYMLGLSESRQSFFIGIRGAFYRIAMIAGQGLIVILAGYLESTMSVGPAEVKVAANPTIFFKETIQVDSVQAKPLAGNLRVIAKPSYVEISTRSKTKDEVDAFVNFARNFNVMNGFSKEISPLPDTAAHHEMVGNVGLVKFILSKPPAKDEEYTINLDYIEGHEGLKVIEGRTFKFTAHNWNKPAFAVIQLDSTINGRTETVFAARTDKVPLAWVFTFVAVAGLFVLFSIYHKLILPRPESDRAVGRNRQSSAMKEFFRTFFRFFEKKKIIIVILFLLFYPLGEAQLVKIVSPFLLDNREIGGLGLTTMQAGLAYATFGIIALILGGLIGGFAISKKGLKYWLWPMLLAINIPHIVYVFLAFVQPTNLYLIYSCVAVEQFGYGFGFTAYLMYLINVADGEYKASHYAIATGFMALGMMVPGMLSGLIQEALGYKMFFIYILFTIIPSIFIIKYIPLEYQFGKKKITEQ